MTNSNRIVTMVVVLLVLIQQSSIMSTMDIVQDGFGFMLAFGDLAWYHRVLCVVLSGPSFDLCVSVDVYSLPNDFSVGPYPLYDVLVSADGLR